MPTNDRVVSIHPYFEVHDGKLDAFKQICEQFMSTTATEKECLYYGFSFNGNMAHCREAYDDGDALLAHLANVDGILKQALQISRIDRLEIHGSAGELAKLQEPLAALSPEYFTLEYGIRRL